MDDTTRRAMLRTGLLAGAAWALAGCQTTARRPRLSPASDTRTSGSTPASDWTFRSQKPEWMDGRPDSAPGGAIRGVQPRASWTSAGPNRSNANSMNGIRRITVHHEGATPFTGTSTSSVSRRLESIRRGHVGSNGWADIGYHFVVDPTGRVWEARPVSLQGAHVKYHNPNNLGVMVLGNFEQQYPTGAATKSLEDFVVAMMRRYKVPVGRVYTHRELRPTACPGRSLQRFMDSSRSRSGALARA